MDNGIERELVRRMLGRDENAFDEFFADYFPRLFRFAVLRLRDQDAAEDLVQNSLIAAVRHLASWRGEATLFTWLCTICRREISAWEKRTSRRVTVSLAEDDPGLRGALESIGAAAEAPDAGLARADTGRIVQLVLDHLPPRYMAEKVGTYYLPALNLINLRAQKEFVIKGSQRLHLMLNIFNLTGAETVTDVVETTGPFFRRPSTNISGTVVRFGTRYTF
jgi:RNA polymerase sigma factor (sigma-70 family)